MSIVAEIESNLTDYLSGDYDIQDAQVIPSPEDVPFGKVARRMDLCVFYIDLRRSTELLFLHQKKTAGKIHKAFLHTAAKTVRHFGGRIRSFKGDSLMALWPAHYKSEITSSVLSGMAIKWLLCDRLVPLFEEYEKLDFGIGVDCGEVYILRAGLPRDTNNNDLLFIGDCVNFAVAIGEQAQSPNNVEISEIVYNNLEDKGRYAVKSGGKVDIWSEGRVTWAGDERNTKTTSYHWIF